MNLVKQSCIREPVARFHYDTDLGKCIEFEYEGCLGTENNFATENDCKKICVPDPVEILGTKEVATTTEEVKPPKYLL